MTTTSTAPRIDLDALMPGFSAAMDTLDAASRSHLDPSIAELVRIRASQINGCAYCVDMHTKDARAAGETEQRVYALPVWRETPFFTERERAALAFAEAVTTVSDGHVPDAVYSEAARQLSDDELAGLVAVLVTINAWNRIGVATRAWTPGSYRPGT